MNDAISPIRGPFADVTEFLDAILSKPLRLERLNAIDQRLKQDLSILNQIKASDVVGLLKLLPVYLFEDWAPSDDFLERFFSGNIEFDHKGQLLGGPPDARLDLDDPYAESELELSDDAKIEGRKLHREIDEVFTRMHVERDIYEYFRRSLQPTTQGQVLLAETKFWPLMEELDHLDLIYGINNPVGEAMDFLAIFLSPTPTCSKSAEEKLKQILLCVFDNCQNEKLHEMTTIAQQIVKGDTESNIFAMLHATFAPTLSAISDADSTSHTDHLHKLFEPLANLDKHLLGVCLATLPLFLARVEEHILSQVTFDEEASEEISSRTADDLTVIEALVYGLIVELAGHHSLDVSSASLAMTEILKNAFEDSFDLESPTIFETARKAKSSKDDAFAHVPASEINAIGQLACQIEKARLRQTSSGRSVYLDARGFFSSWDEAIAAPKLYKKPKLGVAISKAQILLRNTNGYHCSDLDLGLVLSIAESLKDVGFGRVGANILAMFFEALLSEGMKIVTEGEVEHTLIGYNEVVRLFRLHTQLTNDERVALEIAVGRLYPTLDSEQKRYFRGLFPRSIFDNFRTASAAATLSAEIGEQRWEKLKKGIQEELIVGENAFRLAIKRDWDSEATSSRTSVNHWAAALEGLFYEVWSQSFKGLQRDDVSDPVLKKLDGGSASLAEMVNFFLGVPKRLKKSQANSSFLLEFQNSKFALNISGNEDYRRQLKLLGAIRGRAAHFSDEEKRASKVSPTDVFSFRQLLFSSGLFSALVDILD